MEVICNNYEEMNRNIVEAGKRYLKAHPHVESLILGLSGGVDSTLVVALAREICNETGCHKLIGYSIPIESNSQDEIKRASLAGAAFCHEFEEVIWPDKCFFLDLFPNKMLGLVGKVNYKKNFEEKIQAGNIKARMRMMFLYNEAYKNNGLVLSTDNLTEYNLGFWTLHGDVGDLGLIQNLWKTEVYGLADYKAEVYKNAFKREFINWMELGNMSRALKDAIKATPTDGLGVTDSDFDQIGVKSYQEADKILMKYLNTGSKDKELEKHPVIQRHLKYAFKRNNPYNIPRESIIPKPEPIIKDLI